MSDKYIYRNGNLWGLNIKIKDINFSEYNKSKSYLISLRDSILKEHGLMEYLHKKRPTRELSNKNMGVKMIDEEKYETVTLTGKTKTELNDEFESFRKNYKVITNNLSKNKDGWNMFVVYEEVKNEETKISKEDWKEFWDEVNNVDKNRLKFLEEENTRLKDIIVNLACKIK